MAQRTIKVDDETYHQLKKLSKEIAKENHLELSIVKTVKVLAFNVTNIRLVPCYVGDEPTEDSNNGGSPGH